MGRTLLAVLAGLIVMMLTVAAVEAVGHTLFPPPEGVDFRDPEVLRRLMDTLPAQSLAMVVFGWALGSFAGAYIAARIARVSRLSAAIAIGAVMSLLVIANIVMIPHPVWMILARLALPLPLAWLGWRTAAGRVAGGIA